MSRKTVIRIDNEDDEELDDIDDIHSPLKVKTFDDSLISNASYILKRIMKHHALNYIQFRFQDEITNLNDGCFKALRVNLRDQNNTKEKATFCTARKVIMMFIFNFINNQIIF